MPGLFPLNVDLSLPPVLPSQGVPPDEVIDALLSGIVRVRRRAEIYNSDGVTPFDIPNWDKRLQTGSITLDRTRPERRMCDLIFENQDNALQLDPVDGFWYDKIIKCFWGIKYFDFLGKKQSWETQVGEFMIDRIDEKRFPKLVKITGRDYAKKCLKSKLKFSVQFPSTTPIEDMIRALAANAGINKMALPYTGQGYTRDIVFEQFTDRWQIMKDLADSIGYEVFFRGDGYLTMQPYPDPVLSPIAWIFRPGKLDGSLIEFERSSNDSRVYNHVMVRGATVTNPAGFNTTVFSEKLNTDPASPTNIERIGDRVLPYTSDFITTQEQADLIAEQQLRIAALEEYEINFESVVLPWIDVSTIVDIIDSDVAPTTPQRFLLSSLNLSMELGPMSGIGRRVTIVGTNQPLEYA